MRLGSLSEDHDMAVPHYHIELRAGCRRYCLESRLRLALVAAAEVVDEHLFYWLIVGHQDVADGVAADYVADFFGQVFRVIAGAFEGLGHEDDLQTGLAGDVFGILDVAEENQVAEAVD